MTRSSKPLNRRRGSTWMVVTAAIVLVVAVVAFYSGGGGPSVSVGTGGGETPEKGSRAPIPTGPVPAN